MLEHRDQNRSKNEVGSNVASNIPLEVIFERIWADFGVQIFELFLFSGLPICLKFALRAKVALGKPLGLIFELLLIRFWDKFG